MDKAHSFSNLVNDAIFDTDNEAKLVKIEQFNNNISNTLNEIDIISQDLAESEKEVSN